MEKPTELIKKIIDNLTIINNIEKGYSVLEKDIILHNLRTAYTYFLTISAEEGDATPAFQLKEYQNNPEQEARIAQLESELQQRDEEKALLQAQFSQISVQYSQKVKDSAIEIENLKQNNQTLQASLEEKTAQVNTLMQGNQNYTEVLKEKEAIISQLKRELVEKENTIQQLHLQKSSAIIEKEEMSQGEKVSENQFEEEVFFVDEEPAMAETPCTDGTDLLTFPEVASVQPIVIPEEAKEDVSLNIFDDEVEEIQNVEMIVEKAPQAADDRDLLFPAETSKIEEKPRQKSLFDTDESLFKAEKKSLNDLLSNTREDISLGAKFQNARVKDLAKAISINDKFLFIRELFRNRGEEFSKSIQQLNTCNTIDEAFELMETMKKHYAWDTTAQAYLKLCDLVRRKFVD